MDLRASHPSGRETVADVVSSFLDAARTSSIPTCDVWASDVVHDVTVPDWRYHRIGPDAVRETYAGWFSEPGTFVELTRDPFPGGEWVRYVIASSEKGEAYAAHHLHRIEVSGGLIVADVAFCGGRWSLTRQAEMAAAEEQERLAGSG